MTTNAMEQTMEQTSVAPVRKTVTVKAGAERAFQVFTQGIDTWWPRTHHIGKSPMKKAIIEGRAGGVTMKTAVDAPGGWSAILELFAAEAVKGQ